MLVLDEFSFTYRYSGNGGAWGVRTALDEKGGTLPRMNDELRGGTATQA